MEKGFAIIKTHRKSSTDSSKTDNLKEWENSIFQVETTILANLSLIKKMAEACTSGQAKSPTSMKVSSWKARGMEEEHFGGLTEVGMRASLGMGFRVDLEHCIEMEDTNSTRVIGTTVCLTARGFNTLRTVRSMRARLRRTSSMETEYFTRTTLSSTECGRTTSYRW